MEEDDLGSNDNFQDTPAEREGKEDSHAHSI
jgi:hypothetical protein